MIMECDRFSSHPIEFVVLGGPVSSCAIGARNATDKCCNTGYNWPTFYGELKQVYNTLQDYNFRMGTPDAKYASCGTHNATDTGFQHRIQVMVSWHQSKRVCVCD